MRETKKRNGISPENRAKMVSGQRAWISDPENKNAVASRLPNVRAARLAKGEA